MFPNSWRSCSQRECRVPLEVPRVDLAAGHKRVLWYTQRVFVVAFEAHLPETSSVVEAAAAAVPQVL